MIALGLFDAVKNEQVSCCNFFQFLKLRKAQKGIQINLFLFSATLSNQYLVSLEVVETEGVSLEGRNDAVGIVIR